MELTGERIANRLKRQFGDEAGVQVTNSDIIMWINDAIREATTQNNSISLKKAHLLAIQGKNLYELPVAESVSAVHRISYRVRESSAYIPLQYLPPTAFDKQFPLSNKGKNYDTGTLGTPYCYTSYGSAHFVVAPAPGATDSQGFEILFNAYQCEIESLTEHIELNPRYYQYLLEYCLMKAYELDENWEAADRKAAYIQASLNSLHTSDGNMGQGKYPVIAGDD